MKLWHYLKKLKIFFAHSANNCRIIEINTYTHEIIIYVEKKALFLRYTLSDIVSDEYIIDKLTSLESCLLGEYYGKALRMTLESRPALKTVKDMSFLLKNTTGQYKIIFQNRNEFIGYVDRETKKEFLDHPLALVKSEYIISKFNSREACYIGILAGLNRYKKSSFEFTIRNREESKIESMPTYPKLRIVNKIW